MTGVVKAVVVVVVMEGRSGGVFALGGGGGGFGADVEVEVEVEAAGEVVDFRVQ